MGGPIRVIAIDPSGNFDEGKGTTGYIVFNLTDTGYEFEDVGHLSAENYPNRLEYWDAHSFLLGGDLVIIEDYRLYNHKGAKSSMQSYSQMETPRLLGMLEYMAHERGVPVVFQMASEISSFKEDILLARGDLFKVGNRYKLRSGEFVNGHERSAYKHFLKWYHTKGKELKNVGQSR